jgi:ribosomal protein L24
MGQVHQRQLETVVPKAEGSRVLIVAGAKRGSRGRVLKSNSEAQAAAVQLLSDLSVHKVMFDDMAEYVGDDDDGD